MRGGQPEASPGKPFVFSPSTSAASRDAVVAVLALAAAPAVGLGLGRFAYALVLPDMQADFGWSYATAGVPNALNALGYLAGAMAAARAAAAVGALRLVVASTLVAALSTALSAFAWDLFSLSTLRLTSGIAAAFGLVAGGAVAIGFAERAALVISLFYVGPPLGIVVSALAVPPALLAGWAEGWRLAWGALGLASFMLTLAFLAPQLTSAQGGAPKTARNVRAPLRAVAALLVGYGIYGAGYIAYMTFMIAFLREGGADPWREAAFWLAIGCAGIASAWVWSSALGRLRGGLGAAAASLLTAAGTAMPLLGRSFAAELASGVVFGLGAFAIVAATSVYVRRNLPPAAWASGVGAMTVAFSLGQIVGPVLTGMVTDVFGRLDAGLGLGAVLLLVSAAVCALQRDLSRGSAVGDAPLGEPV